MRLRRAIAAVLPIGVIALVPSIAQGDSIVYVDHSGHVAIAKPDGTGARTVTSNTGWKWPSQSDGGTVAALAPAGDVRLMNQAGSLTGDVKTPSSVSGGFDVTLYPRISPDGSKVAYGNLDPSNGASVYWGPTNTTSFSRPNQSLGQEDMTAPSWVDSTKMLLTHYGETVTDTQKQLYFYSAGNGDNTETGWGIDPYTPSFINGDSWEATNFAGAINRQETAVAFAMDDGGDHAVIHVFPTTGNPPQLDTSRGCQLTLLPNGSDSIADDGEISPSFSPDGSRFAYATDAGVWIATVPTDFSDCSGLSSTLTITGGSYPYWSPAGIKSLLSVKKSGTGLGSVTSSPAGISCGSTCSHLYNQGTTVILTAHAASGSRFAGWSGAGCAGTGTCTVTMNANRAVTATFTRIPPPNTTITSHTVRPVKRTASFSFTGSGGVAPLHFKCKLDGAAYTSCTSPKSYSGLKVGSHTFRVEAIDSRGMVDPTPATYGFKVTG